MSVSDVRFASYPVWDLPTRLFHWINFVCIVALSAIGTAILFDKDLGVTDGGKILLKTTHVWFGYVFAVNLIVRLVWAFAGNKHARWGAILPFYASFGRDFAAYVRSLSSDRPQAYQGHNPIARLMVALMFLLLAVQAATGLVLAGTDIYFPPLGSWVTAWIAAPGTDPATLVPYNMSGIDKASWDAMREFRAPFVTTHYWVFFGLIAAIALHIAGVVWAEIREGGGLISAMFTGTKIFDRRPVDADEENLK